MQPSFLTQIDYSKSVMITSEKTDATLMPLLPKSKSLPWRDVINGDSPLVDFKLVGVSPTVELTMSRSKLVNLLEIALKDESYVLLFQDDLENGELSSGFLIRNTLLFGRKFEFIDNLVIEGVATSLFRKIPAVRKIPPFPANHPVRYKMADHIYYRMLRYPGFTRFIRSIFKTIFR